MGAVLLAEPVLRRLEARDLPEALRLTQAQNWSHRLEDWEFHFRFGRGWAACDADGRLLGTALWWAYGTAFATVGLVVVRPDCQGQGIGRRLMDAVIAHAGERTLQLLATRAGLRLYEQTGFVAVESISQCQGIVQSVAAVVPEHLRLRPAARADLDAACRLDSMAIGSPRRELIEAVFEAGGGGGVVAERQDVLMGFALQRASGRGTLLGPLVASDEDVAIGLVRTLLGTCPGFCRLDIPTRAAALGACLARAGLPAVDQVVRMIRGPMPPANAAARTFGLVSQALG
jgi:GNAT superfamily N-acetyltransferase